MRMLVVVVLVGCSGGDGGSSDGPVDHVFAVTARFMGEGACADAGTPTEPAVPFRALVADDEHPGQQAWTWCNSRTQCDPVSDRDWFVADGDHWTRIDAEVINAPDNAVTCALSYDTLAVRELDGTTHVDLLQRGATTGDLEHCTQDVAIAQLAESGNCFVIDRYDLVP